MKDKFEAYGRALEKLKEVLGFELTEVNRDATIQRFEFTYELAWNVLKKYLQKIGVDCLNPRDCFKAAFQQKLIGENSEAVWLDMIKDRNLTSHIYDEATAQKIYDKIKRSYYKALESLRAKLREKM